MGRTPLRALNALVSSESAEVREGQPRILRRPAMSRVVAGQLAESRGYGGWTLSYWHDDIGKSFLALMEGVDALLLGRGALTM